MWNENGSACVCVQGNLGKLCPAVGPHGPWATSGPSPHAGAGWRTSAAGEFMAGLSGEEEELVTIASFHRRCRRDSLISLWSSRLLLSSCVRLSSFK